MNFRGIGISHLPNQRYKHLCQKKFNYNIMIVGSSGSGKSTFINQLFKTNIISSVISEESIIMHKDNYDLNVNVEMPEDYSYKNSLLNFELTSIDVTGTNFCMNINITEVSNVGNAVDNEDCWVPIKNYIEDLHKDYYFQFKENVTGLIKDRRIHCVVYFIDACGSPIREIDLRVMKEIGDICNLIPVVSKCDVLLFNEMEIYYEKIVSEIKNKKIKIYRNMDDVIDIDPPYFMMSQRFGRIAQLEDYGDFEILKDVLITNGMNDLLVQTDKLYESFKASLIMNEIYSNKSLAEDLKLKANLLTAINQEDIEEENSHKRKLKKFENKNTKTVEESYSTSAITESIEIANIAKKEIEEIKQEINAQNERLLIFQKKNSAIYYLLRENNKYIDSMFIKSRKGYLYVLIFVIIFVLLIVFLRNLILY